ncbi:hypothetical protein Rrhod_3803 [Rhodococcus rhodnii LMG 5362]|uniref:Uncharacterized protein n=1 Tax=Rhodococcus rhodnii LMG 5362 TaxID=1273125 RepID=R7WIC7_9NOCA|nr:hypothetical protein Rrhod_3803 [Rhodococcus rhodnii LMG 5362]
MRSWFGEILVGTLRTPVPGSNIPRMSQRVAGTADSFSIAPTYGESEIRPMRPGLRDEPSSRTTATGVRKGPP